MPSNQGRDMDPVMRDVSMDDIAALTVVLWAEVHHHPSDASCECPVFEVLCRLYELGYEVKKVP
jgi:hypothetical protein